MRMQVLRVILPIGIKALVDGKLGRDAARERNRAAVLDDLARRLSEGAVSLVRAKARAPGWAGAIL